MRGCVFDRGTQLGAFAVLPLTDALDSPAARLGARFSSPELSLGFTSQPFQGALTSLWAVRSSLLADRQQPVSLICWLSEPRGSKPCLSQPAD